MLYKQGHTRTHACTHTHTRTHTHTIRTNTISTVTISLANTLCLQGTRKDLLDI
uniref:Uncharacterized protein n=1 Tax=Anguilla anguilla TaxID=7936 RepID=A0A0E9PBC3_ANGAN